MKPLGIQEGIEKINAGMKILIREGSAARNLDALAPLYDIAPEKLMLCSDDIHPEMLLERHINGLVSELVKRGYNLFDVLRSACNNAVDHYKIDVGLLREGDKADFIVVKDLEEFRVLETWINGRKIYSEGKVHFDTIPADEPNLFNSSLITVGDINRNRKGTCEGN